MVRFPLRPLASAAALLVPVAIALAHVLRPPPPSAPSRPRDLLVITLDTTRRDYLGCYGRTPSPTPALDAFAAGAIRFDQAFTTAPITLPAHSSLFTGLYPTRHGVRYNSGFRLPDEAVTLAELLRDAGYATAASVGSFVLDPIFGLAQGFERYRAPDRELSRPDAPAAEAERPAAPIVDEVLAEFAAAAAAGPDRRPLFCWAHFYDPHLPYAPQRPPLLAPDVAADRRLSEKAYYEQELRELDEQLGRLFRGLEAQGVLEQLVVVVTADHGESLHDAHEAAHGFFLFDPTVQVPLLLRHPELAPGVRTTPISHIDLLPTLLPLLAIGAAGAPLDGLDLTPWLADETLAPPERALLLESQYGWLNFGWAPQFGALQDEWKYLRSAREELFDRATDPRERENRFAPDDRRATALRRRVDDYLARVSDWSSISGALSDEDRRRLESLGYAADGGAAGAFPTDWSELPDLYARLPSYERMHETLADALPKGLDAAIAALRGILVDEPRSAPMHWRLGTLLMAKGPESFAEAEAELAQAVVLDPGSARLQLELARCAEARAKLLREQASRARAAGELAEARGHAATERKTAALAEAALARALEIDPRYPDALALLQRRLAARVDRQLQQGEPAAKVVALLGELDAVLGRLIDVLPAGSPAAAAAAADRARVAAMIAKQRERGAGGT